MKDIIFDRLDCNAIVYEKYTEVNDFLIRTIDQDSVKLELFDESVELILEK